MADYLQPGSIGIETGRTGWLRCRLADGRTLEEVHCSRLFPISDPDRYISLYYKDKGEHREIGIIRDLGEWRESVRDGVRRVLSDSYFAPEITDIHSISHRFGMQEWRVTTDRGPRTFTVVKAREAIREAANGTVAITDMETCRYRISRPGDLGVAARRELLRALP